MKLTGIDRNRITVAFVLTAVALPLMFMASGSGADGGRSTVESTTSSTINVGLASDPNAKADAPANLGGPAIGDPNGQGQIAYPADNSGRMVRATASYKRLPEVSNSGCSTDLVPLGSEITVRNLNNGRKVTCTNINIGGVPSGADLVLNTRLFESIADLIDAPIPVELTW